MGNGGNVASHGWRDVLADKCLCAVDAKEPRWLRGTSMTGSEATVGVGAHSMSYFSAAGSLAADESCRRATTARHVE